MFRSHMNTDAVKSGHVINETSSITDADGHHMHIMEGDVAVPDHDDAVNEINKSSQVRYMTTGSPVPPFLDRPSESTFPCIATSQVT